MSVVIAPVFEGVDVLHIERFAIEMNRLIEKHFAYAPVTGAAKCKLTDNECGNSAEFWKKYTPQMKWAASHLRRSGQSR